MWAKQTHHLLRRLLLASSILWLNHVCQTKLELLLKSRLEENGFWRMIPEASCMRFNKAKCPVLQSTRVRGNGLKLFQGRFRTDIREKKKKTPSLKRQLDIGKKLPREVVKTPSLKRSKGARMSHLGMWFSGGTDGAGVRARFNDLRGLFSEDSSMSLWSYEFFFNLTTKIVSLGKPDVIVQCFPVSELLFSSCCERCLENHKVSSWHAISLFCYPSWMAILNCYCNAILCTDYHCMFLVF